jgi:hypothetical protein
MTIIGKYKLLSLATLLIFLLLPTIGQPCPKCFASTSKQVLNTYYFTSLILIFIPIAIVGSILAWIFFKIRKFQREVNVASVNRLQ